MCVNFSEGVKWAEGLGRHLLYAEEKDAHCLLQCIIVGFGLLMICFHGTYVTAGLMHKQIDEISLLGHLAPARIPQPPRSSDARLQK